VSAPEVVRELERELATAWSRDHLAVYADHLQALGDPRGELIAIDLAGRPAASEGRRAQLVATWLAELPAGGDTASVDHGFLVVELRDPDALATLLASRFGPHIRTLTVTGAGDVIAEAVKRLGDQPLPLLDRLVLNHGGDVPRTPLVAAETAARLATATPNLLRLDVNGRRVFGQFVHPHVTTLVVSGFDALASLSGRGAALPIATLDFAFHRTSLLDHLPPPADPLVRALLPADRLPRLRRLDLSRNEPGGHPPHHLGGQIDPFAWLRRTKLAQLTHLRLPSLRSEAQLAELEAALVHLPNLVEVALARAYAESPDPPPPITAPPRRLWPPSDQIHGRDALTINLEGHPYGEDVDLTGAVELMERAYETLPPTARAAWDEFWAFLADLGWEDADGSAIVMHLSTRVLVTMLEPLDLEDERRWSDLRMLLRQRTATLPDTVSIRRYWGW
jgi:hypothetical protein